MFALIFKVGYSLNTQDSISSILGGKWNISRIEVTNNGYENPDIQKFFVDLESNPEKKVFNGTIFQSPQYNEDTVQNREMKLFLDEESQKIKIYMNDSLIFDDSYDFFSNGLQISQGFLPNSKKYYSFIIMSVFRCQITVYDRETNQIIIYRMMHELKNSGDSILTKILKFFFQRVLFSFIH